MKIFKSKIGDTLVEVALAIGIFSMVAIAVVSVVSGSSSSTQAALETTITREEIDTQAEALRFIHASYNAGGEVGGSEASKYKTIWNEIIKNAVDPSVDSSEIVNAVTNYSPDTCSVLYKESSSDANYIGNQGAFIINTKNLSMDNVNSSNVGNIIVRSDSPTGKSIFKSAATYPRLVYTDDSDALLNLNDNNTLQSAEGIYIVAVKDPNTTAIISDDGGGGQVQSMSAYYDFYIHTCWYNPNEERPSTISTVVRLYDPDTISINQYSRKIVTINYNGNGATSGSMPAQYVLSGRTITLLQNKYERPGYRFLGWSDDGNNKTVEYTDKDAYKAYANLATNQTVTLTAVWGYVYTLTYYGNDGVTELCKQEGVSTEASYTFTIGSGSCAGVKPTNSDTRQVFQGWSEDKIEGKEPLYNKNGTDDTNSTITATAITKQNIKLYPVWRIVVTFSGDDWTKDGYDSASDCYIFQVNKPSNGYSQEIKKGNYYGGGTAPMDGYLVSGGGQHIETFTNGINFQGYCYRSANVGVYYEIGKNDTFELSAKMNTAGMQTHPGGYVNVSIGPISATIYRTYITATCNGSSNTEYFSSSSVIGLKLSKYNNDYDMSVDNKTVKSCTVPNHTDGNDKIKIKYYMIHSSHGCSSVFNVQLTDIKMKRVIKE